MLSVDTARHIAAMPASSVPGGGATTLTTNRPSKRCLANLRNEWKSDAQLRVAGGLSARGATRPPRETSAAPRLAQLLVNAGSVNLRKGCSENAPGSGRPLALRQKLPHKPHPDPLIEVGSETGGRPK